jgi:isoquinoline 1-oxidoreductase beta subunit
MANIARIARRSFPIGTGAMAAGLAVGSYLYKRDPGNPLLTDLPENTAVLNPYVRIDSRGITLITPRADLGQGAYSVQAALIAEELDVAWGQFQVEPGPPSAAYYNGTVMAESFPIAATSDTFMARSGRGAAGAMGKLLGIQVTGGSSTVPDAFDRLRVAGASHGKCCWPRRRSRPACHSRNSRRPRVICSRPTASACPTPRWPRRQASSAHRRT